MYLYKTLLFLFSLLSNVLCRCPTIDYLFLFLPFLIISFFFISVLIFGWLLLPFQWRPQAIVFEIVTDKKFDIIIMLFIGLNMFTMTLDRYDASDTYNAVLDYLNAIFVVIFSSECLLKIFALRYHYFIEPWNLFDVVVVILSILGK